MAEAIRLGVLYDYPQGDGGESFEAALRLGLAEVALDRDVDIVSRHAHGLPGGTSHAVERAFAELVADGALLVVGPSISDNGLVVRDLANWAEVPCINYTGGERTRSEWMFHYQVGSLAEEPVVLAQHLAGLGSVGSVVVVHDQSPVGHGYAEAFRPAALVAGLDVVGSAAVPPTATDLAAVVERLRRSAPDALCYLGLGVTARAVALGLGNVGWDVRAVANSALMFGYAEREWRAGWDGWAYVDTVADSNARRQALRALSARTAAGPVGVAAYDIGRLCGEALARCEHLTRAGVRDGFERVKRLPAASGRDGTTMGFGVYDHGALKGEYLVLRTWRDGHTVEVGGGE